LCVVILKHKFWNYTFGYRQCRWVWWPILL
jgi:hypothetical protein